MTEEPLEAPFRPSSLRENAWGATFLLLLLLVSGITATVVGYRVKVADMERKDDLRKRYEALGGSQATLYQLGSSLEEAPNCTATDEAAHAFIAVYELNERIRLNGFAPTIASMTPKQREAALRGLRALGATLAADALAASDQATTERGRPPRYDRKVIRAVEVALVGPPPATLVSGETK